MRGCLVRRFLGVALVVAAALSTPIYSSVRFTTPDTVAGHRLQHAGGSVKEVRIVTGPHVLERGAPRTARPPGTKRRDGGRVSVGWNGSDPDAITDRLAVSADGSVIAVGYSLNRPRVEFLAADGSVRFGYALADDPAGIALDSVGVVAAVSAGDSLWVFGLGDNPTLKWRKRLEGRYAGPVGVSPDAARVYATAAYPDSAGSIWCLSAEEGSPLWSCRIDSAYSWVGLTMSGDGRVVAVTDKYRLVVVEVSSGTVIWDAPTYNTESAVALSADAECLVVASLTGWVRSFRRTQDGYREVWRHRFSADLGSWVTACALSADGEVLAVGTLDFYQNDYAGRVSVFDNRTGSVRWTSDLPADEISALWMSPDGSFIAAVSWGDLDNQVPDLFIFESHTPEPFYTLNTPGSLDAVVASAEGRMLVVGGKAVHNRVWGRGGQFAVLRLERTGAFVQGVVSDTSDAPVPGAEVTAVGSPYRTLTDSSGYFCLWVETFGSGASDLLVRRYGYRDAIRPGVLVSPGDTTLGVRVALEPAGLPPAGLRASRNFPDRIVLSWLPPARSSPSILVSPGLGRHPRESQPVRPAADAERTEELFREWMSPEDTPAVGSAGSSSSGDSVRIYRCPALGGDYTLIAAVSGDVTRYEDTAGLLPGMDYVYVLTYRGNDEESRFSEPAVGRLADSIFNYTLALSPAARIPVLDGLVDSAEWSDGVRLDISDLLGYDRRDSAGSVRARLLLDDTSDRLWLGVEYLSQPVLADRMGVGVYVDDDGDGEWAVDKPGTEGNYWGYWIDGAPDMRFRSLSGGPYAVQPYYAFNEPELRFSDARGWVSLEMAIPLGFRAAEQVGLHYPDYTVGLGLFAVRRLPDGRPEFNGWWPQDMLSIVTEPGQFARVRLSAEVPAPPDAPASVELVRQARALGLSWVDPPRAVDGGSVRGFGGIVLRRNGEVQAVLSPGVRAYLDTTVAYGCWYEYTLTGFVWDGGDRFEGPETEPLGAYAGREPATELLAHDDGTPEAFYFVSAEGADNRFAVRFELYESLDTLEAFWVEIFAQDAGTMRVWLEADSAGHPGGPICDPQLAALTAAGLYRYHFPGSPRPQLSVPGGAGRSVWAVAGYTPESPSQPALGVDYSRADGARNLYYTEASGWQTFSPGQIMLRLAVGDKVRPPADGPAPPPSAYALGAGFPNPLNGVGLIPLDLPQSSPVSLELLDATGRRLQVIDFGVFPAGKAHLMWNARNLGSGWYVAKVRAGDFTGLVPVCVVR